MKKNRSLILLVVLIIVTLSLMFVTSDEDDKVTTVGGLLGELISPIQKGIYTASSSVYDFFDNIKDRRDLKNKYNELQETVTTLNEELIEKRELEKENNRLKQLLDFKDRNRSLTVTGARVIAKDPGNWFNTFIIDRGTTDGVEVDMVVVNDDGLVGRIFECGFNWSKVRSIVDGHSSVSGIIERTRDNGIVKGENSLTIKNGLCRMIYLPIDSQLQQGDTVITSGMGEIFPKGIFIGHIEEVIIDKTNHYTTAIIKPAVDFKHIEEVLVVKSSREELVFQ